jgi:uncharacterized SAM-binding protein YcdF (DUF218 family)
MTRLAAVVIVVFLLVFTLTALAVLAFAFRPLGGHRLPETAPLVIVLDGGRRYDLGVRLIEEGRADWIHFSSGSGSVERPRARRLAGQARHDLGDVKITFEDSSRTTLQNAYFTVRELGVIPPGSILVTDSTHLFRAWMAFRLVGAQHLHLAPASDFAQLSPKEVLRDLLREAAGVWLNLGRMAVFALAVRIRGAPEGLEDILAYP